MTFEIVAAPIAQRASIPRFAPAVVGALILAAAALQLHWPPPSDASWLLTVCERMLAGQRLYVDIAELNPPMSPWLYLPWVVLARALGIAAETVLAIGTIAVCLASIWLTDRVLSSADLLRSRSTWWIVGTFALIVAPIYTFAQREHFAVAFALPMLAAVAVRASGARVASWAVVVTGLCAALVVAVKPHFALAIVLPIASLCVARRSLRPAFARECLLGAAGLLGYLASVGVLYPDYYATMLPVVVDVYLPNRNPLDILLSMPFTLVASLCVLACAMRDRDKGEPFTQTLLAAALGFFVAYLLQGRGWPYHLMPAVTLAIIAFGLSLKQPWSGQRPIGLRVIAAKAVGGLAAAGVLLSLVMSAVERNNGELTFERAAAEALAPLGGRLKMALLSADLTLGSPLHRSIGATLVNRGPSLWVAGNALDLLQKRPGDPRSERWRAAIEQDRSNLLEDMKRNPPDVIVAAYTLRDWLSWANEDPTLAEFLSTYSLFADVDAGGEKARILARPEALRPQLRPSLDAPPRP